MWLHKPPEFFVPVLVPETMRDTIARCLKDGWTECPDPRLPVEATDEAIMPDLSVPADAASTAQVLPELPRPPRRKPVANTKANVKAKARR